MASCTCAWRCSPAKSSHTSPVSLNQRPWRQPAFFLLFTNERNWVGGGAERTHLIGLPRSEFQLQIGGRVIGSPKLPSKTFPVVQGQVVCSYLPPPGCPQPPLGQGGGRLPCPGLSTCTALNSQPRQKALPTPSALPVSNSWDVFPSSLLLFSLLGVHFDLPCLAFSSEHQHSSVLASSDTTGPRDKLDFGTGLGPGGCHQPLQPAGQACPT